MRCTTMYKYVQCVPLPPPREKQNKTKQTQKNKKMLEAKRASGKCKVERNIP